MYCICFAENIGSMSTYELIWADLKKICHLTYVLHNTRTTYTSLWCHTPYPSISCKRKPILRKYIIPGSCVENNLCWTLFGQHKCSTSWIKVDRVNLLFCKSILSESNFKLILLLQRVYRYSVKKGICINFFRPRLAVMKSNINISRMFKLEHESQTLHIVQKCIINIFCKTNFTGFELRARL